MKLKLIEIEKPKFHSDIWGKIYRSFDYDERETIDMKTLLEDSQNKTFYYTDLLNKRMFIYKGLESEDTVEVLSFKTNQEIFDWIKRLKESYKEELQKDWRESTIYDNIKDRLKELKLLLELEKPHKVKEIIKENKKIKVGDLVSTCWGYDQTNVEIFEIVKILGKNYFIMKECAQSRVEGTEGVMCTNIKPTRIYLNKLPIKGFISNDGYMSVCETGYKRSLSLTDENKEHYKSWYH